MLTEWFVDNKNNPDVRDLTYYDFPSKWRWDDTTKVWKPRKTTKGKIARLYYVHPLAGERYYLRMLLLTIKGACDYDDLRRYNNVLYPTFKEACRAQGLLMIRNCTMLVMKLQCGQHLISFINCLSPCFFIVK
jgi:hypothetical protein